MGEPRIFELEQGEVKGHLIMLNNERVGELLAVVAPFLHGMDGTTRLGHALRLIAEQMVINEFRDFVPRVLAKSDEALRTCRPVLNQWLEELREDTEFPPSAPIFPWDSASRDVTLWALTQVLLTVLSGYRGALGPERFMRALALVADLVEEVAAATARAAAKEGSAGK